MPQTRHTASRLLLFVLAPVVLSACTQVGVGEAPGPAPVEGSGAEGETGPPATPSEAEAARITSGVVQTALAAIGTPYVWGGTNANGFDCSGLIQYAYGEYGIALPRVSTQQMQTGRALSLDPDGLRPGDILGFSTDDPDKTSHVGLYVGNGEFIHSGSRGVSIATLENPYWQEHLLAARRVIP